MKITNCCRSRRAAGRIPFGLRSRRLVMIASTCCARNCIKKATDDVKAIRRNAPVTRKQSGHHRLNELQPLFQTPNCHVCIVPSRNASVHATGHATYDRLRWVLGKLPAALDVAENNTPTFHRLPSRRLSTPVGMGWERKADSRHLESTGMIPSQLRPNLLSISLPCHHPKRNPFLHRQTRPSIERAGRSPTSP